MAWRYAILSPYRHRELVTRLVRRELAARYRGSMLGPLWAVALPLASLGIYTVAFGSGLRGNARPAGSDDAPFAIVLFSGLFLFQILGEMLTGGPSLVRSNATYVKQIVFPVEILPVVALLVALFNATVSGAILLVAYAATVGAPPATALWIPVAALPIAVLGLGISYALSALGLFVRDLAQVVGLASMALLFGSPIFYSLDALPEHLRGIVGASPVAVSVTAARTALLEGETPALAPLAWSLLLALVVLAGGRALFARLRPHFADVA